MLLAQVAMASSNKETQVAPETINRTFLWMGLGGVGLMVRVWLDAAFA